MKYLCQKHQYAVVSDAKLARDLWGRAMRHGERALDDGNWEHARALFGSAFEICAIQLQSIKLYGGVRDSGLEAKNASLLRHISKYVQSGKSLVAVTNYLGDVESAEDYLIQMHDALLPLAENRQCEFAVRTQSFSLMGDIHDELIKLLHSSQQKQELNSLVSFSEKVQRNIASEIFH